MDKAAVRRDRRHPARLPAEQYTVPETTVFYTACARPGVVLADAQTASAVLAALGRSARRCGVCLHAYCLMPDHLHVVCSIGSTGGDLALWVRRFKSASSRRARTALWQRSYWDRSARGDEDAPTMVEYTLMNPVRKGLCDDWTEWPWSWSEWHGGGGPAEGDGAVGEVLGRD